MDSIKPHSEEKYRHLDLYMSLFTTAMKPRWTLLYIDLFAGAGVTVTEGSQECHWGSPFLALRQKKEFDKHIFCEMEEPYLSALRTRTARLFPEARVTFLPGDCNANVEAILAAFPTGDPKKACLAVCVVDPKKMDDLAFDTLRKLSSKRIDFLVLLPTFMDSDRNYDTYVDASNEVVARFTGRPAWRADWPESAWDGNKFRHFVADQFSKSMAELVLKYGGIENAKQIMGAEGRLRLYHLALFSRDPTASKFWNESMKYATPQLDMFPRGENGTNQ